MTPGSASDYARDIPPALHGEIVRSGLLSRLDLRWQTPITTIVAGAGFGKSTVVAQARRLQSLAPDGLEVYHRCDDGDEAASRLAASIVRSVDRDRATSREPVDSVLDALASVAPVPVCLILDDVHELPEGSSGAQLVSDLLERLPHDAHLVLVGRRLPALRIAHLQAADAVLHIDAGELSFSSAELREIAGQAGRPFESVERLGGWPALVRLTLTAPVGASRQYLWDEVVTNLDPDLRATLPFLALAGELDRHDIERLVGHEVDPERLAARIPLVGLSDRGSVRCHQLWRDVANRVWERRDVEEARRAVVELLLAGGQVVRAGSVAVDGRDMELLGRPAVALVSTTIGAFPADTGERWLRELGVHGPVDEPGVELLRVATMQAGNPHDPDIAVALDTLLTGENVPAPIMIPALAVGGIAAHAITDVAWLQQLVERARRFAADQDEPIARLVLAGISAAAAELDGDVARGLADIEAIYPGASLGDTVARFYVHLLILDGRADDAIPIADSIAAGGHRIGASRYPAFARWCAGDPSGMLHHSDLDPEVGTNDRFRFAYNAHNVPICGCLGRVDILTAALAELRLASYGSPKDRAQMMVAEAFADIMRGDEPAAAARYAEHLAEFPSADLMSAVHLRRYPAIGFVLHPDDDDLWDRAGLGPTLRRQLDVGQLLVQLRDGSVDAFPELPSSNLILTSLPLPWSTELIARAHALGHTEARSRFTDLVSMTDGRAHDELRAQIDEARLPGAGEDLVRLVRRPSSTVVRLELLEGMRMLVDGEPVEPPELRRRRVREILGLLIVEGPMTRGQIIECVWPDRDGTTASRNLRVTLSYVRRVLEVGGASAGAQLTDSGETLSLSRVPMLETDLWDLRAAAADLAVARQHGDALAIEDALHRIVALGTHDPLPDLVDIVAVRSTIEWCRAESLDAILSLGERRLTQGRAAEALALANSARSVSVWSERAGRLAIAAQLLCGDTEHAAVEAERLREMLDDLGVEADDRTQLLLTRARGA